MLWNHTNPHEVDIRRPYLYLIVIQSPTRVYRYVGKGSARSRMSVYYKMVRQIHAGEPKCRVKTRDGRDQSKSNMRYRYVHLVLAVAVERGWKIEHYPLENCDKLIHNMLEAQRIVELKCDMNNRPSWYVEDYQRLALTIM